MSILKFADIDEQCRRYNQLKQDDIAKLVEWQRKQPHLPAPLHPIETALFLHRCRFNVEAAKERIDAYYSFRTRYPEFFNNRKPFGSQMQRDLDTSLVTILPELTPEGYLVIYARLLDRNVGVYSFLGMLRISFIVIELIQKQYGCHAGIVSILDLEGYSLSHVLKVNIIVVRKILLFIHKMLPLRLKSLHFVNGVPFMDKIMALVRPLVKKDFPVQVHFGDNATIFNFIPKNILPIQCGGPHFCAIDYYKKVTRVEIEGNCEYFKVEENQLVDECKRLGNRTKFHDLLGMDGTFKHLDVD